MIWSFFKYSVKYLKKDQIIQTSIVISSLYDLISFVEKNIFKKLLEYKKSYGFGTTWKKKNIYLLID